MTIHIEKRGLEDTDLIAWILQRFSDGDEVVVSYCGREGATIAPNSLVMRQEYLKPGGAGIAGQRYVSVGWSSPRRDSHGALIPGRSFVAVEEMGNEREVSK